MCTNIILKPLQLAALAAPIRQRIVEILCVSERTVGELANDLGQAAPSNLYYHMTKLREAGLIKVVRTEQRRGALEKHYRASAKEFSIPYGMGVPGEPNDLVGAATASAENALRDLGESVAAGNVQDVEDLFLSRTIIRTSPKKFVELRKKLQAWMRAFAKADDEGDVELTTTIMMFPRTSLDP